MIVIDAARYFSYFSIKNDMEKYQRCNFKIATYRLFTFYYWIWLFHILLFYFSFVSAPYAYHFSFFHFLSLLLRCRDYLFNASDFDADFDIFYDKAFRHFRGMTLHSHYLASLLPRYALRISARVSSVKILFELLYLYDMLPATRHRTYVGFLL